MRKLITFIGLDVHTDFGKQYEIRVSGSTVGNNVYVDGPVVKWENWNIGQVGL